MYIFSMLPTSELQDHRLHDNTPKPPAIQPISVSKHIRSNFPFFDGCHKRRVKYIVGIVGGGKPYRKTPFSSEKKGESRKPISRTKVDIAKGVPGIPAEVP